MLKLPGYARVLRDERVHLHKADYCSFGMPWRKSTAIMCCWCDLRCLNLHCTRDHVHINLRGSAPGGKPWTLVAQGYPEQLCAKWADAIHRGILAPFDATLGFPGEGWRRCWLSWLLMLLRECQGLPKNLHGAARQGARDLLGTRIEKATRDRRERGMMLFARFLAARGTSLDLLQHDPGALQDAAGEWVQYCYDESCVCLPDVKAAIQDVTDRFPALHAHMRKAWLALESWEQGEPISMRAPMPRAVASACVCLALSWHWLATALIMWLGFHCALRPAEMVNLRWHDVLLPEWSAVRACFEHFGVCRIMRPKTRKTAGRRQMVLITDQWLLWFLSAVHAVVKPSLSDLMCSYSAATLNARLKVLIGSMGFAVGTWSMASL